MLHIKFCLNSMHRKLNTHRRGRYVVTSDATKSNFSECHDWIHVHAPVWVCDVSVWNSEIAGASVNKYPNTIRKLKIQVYRNFCAPVMLLRNWPAQLSYCSVAWKFYIFPRRLRKTTREIMTESAKRKQKAKCFLWFTFVRLMCCLHRYWKMSYKFICSRNRL